MFPESLEDYGFVNNNTNGSNQQNQMIGNPTAVQRLIQPTQQLKTAIMNLINYQEDADVTIKAIPELLKLLNDDDKSVVCKTLKLIDQLSRKDASKFALTSSKELINALINLILNTNDLEVHNSAASILNNLSSNNKQALYVIFKSGGIPALIKLLSSPIESVVYYATTTLHSLLMHEPNAKAQVIHYNGTRKMVELLSQNNNAKFLALLVDSLHILAFNNSEVKLVIQTSGGPKELIRIMRSSNYSKLIWTCVRLMKVLSVCPENKKVLVENGAMQVLSAHLQNPSNDDRVVYNCLLSLRNLSDCAIREDNLDGLIKRLIDLLNANTDINVSTCAAGILSNLTCNNDLNKMKFVEYNGIEIILRAMLQAGPENKEDICEPAICSLRHVTNRHAQAQVAQEAVRYYYGLPVIAPLLQSDSSRWPLLKATIGLIRNLALSDNNLAPLRELGIIPRLVQLLIKAINAHQQAQQSGLDSAIIDDVPMEEIIEGTVGALHQLARDPHNGIVIRELKCIPVLVQLLFMPWESIVRVACGCLSELANDRLNTELIENERITDKLTELLRSKDHAISTYAAAILFRLSEDKPSSDGLSPNEIMASQNPNWNGSNVNYAMNSNDPALIYGGNNNLRLNNAGANDQYVSYNTIDPYELELQQSSHYNQLVDVPIMPSQINHQQQHNQAQSPATWFDTDL
jgi:catenin beta 1